MNSPSVVLGALARCTETRPAISDGGVPLPVVALSRGFDRSRRYFVSAEVAAPDEQTRTSAGTELAVTLDDSVTTTAGLRTGSLANLSMADAVRQIALVVPDFHTADHDQLPMWHPERAACATCMSDEQIEVVS